MKRKVTILVALILVLGLALAGAQASGKKYVLKFNHVLTTQDPYHGAFLKWAEAVSARIVPAASRKKIRSYRTSP